MSSKNSKPTEPRGARAALRQQQQAQLAAQDRAKKVIRAAWIVGLAVIVGLVGLVVWSVIQSNKNTDKGVVASDGVSAPRSATESGAILIGQEDAPVTLSVYSDFMCPYCGQFETVQGESISKAVADGDCKLEIHPMAFLDAQSRGAKYSTRASNAFATIANADTEAAMKFYSLLYANQPEEGTSGLTDEQIADFATQAGASAEVVDQLSRDTFEPWVAKITQQAFADGVQSTPTIKVNGTELENPMEPGAITKAIADAKTSGN